jgi:ATP-dependent DNA helicase RecG
VKWTGELDWKTGEGPRGRNETMSTSGNLKLDTPVQFIKGVGPKLGDVLRKKGVETVGDLLEWYPRAYEDRRAARTIASLKPDELVSLKARIVRVSSFNMGASRRKIYDVVLTDGTGKIHCKYFRTPYKGYFEKFQPNQEVRVIGKVGMYRGQIEFNHPDIQDIKPEMAPPSGSGGGDPEGDGEFSGERDQMIPIYPESEGLTNRQIRKLVQIALEIAKSPQGQVSSAAAGAGRGPKVGSSAAGGRLPLALRDKKKSFSGGFQEQAPEPFEKIPEWIRQKYDLVGRYEALKNVHVPPSDAGAEFAEQNSKYHRRVIFEEFFWLELYLASKKSGLQRESAPAFKPAMALVEKLRAQLPFQFTGAQSRALGEIVRDLAKPHPMHRLVQGDVGSGKTLVALAAALVAKENGFQTAIMVPTEILSEQHYQNAQKFLEPLGLTIGLLTGSMKTAERNQTYEMLRNGAIDLVVGTHALIQDAVEFKNLGLVVIDEQHRFGVHQRTQLKKKGISPHFLVMTATPIPRTLAMTVYGDLDVSVIDELPPGRSPIVTRVTYESKRDAVIGFIRDQLKAGRQAYVVYPLVEESEKIDLKDAVSAYQELEAEFEGEFHVGLLHGKMKADEKDDVMKKFRAKEFDLLVSTTVIEVGVDVPNANIMLIEHAERFGLSQLHQLRGRVGRGQHKSYCVLMLGKAVSDESRERTQIMEKTSDGFKIAEADLAIRGPGEFLGARQSGLPGFKMANLVRDVKVLQEARTAAFEALEKDPGLSKPENLILRSQLSKTQATTTA